MNFDQLITSLRELDSSLRNQVARSSNMELTTQNWLVGAYIVEFEQNGEERAEYGQELIRTIAKTLNIRGLNPTNLELCRRLFSEYREIPQTLSVDSSGSLEKQPAMATDSQRPDFALPVAELLEKLSFSHFVELLRIHDPLQRAFYEYALGGMDENLFVSQYQLQLSSTEEIEIFLRLADQRESASSSVAMSHPGNLAP